eukprot:1150497-Pelagomonas_calceolata.AAC.10
MFKFACTMLACFAHCDGIGLQNLALKLHARSLLSSDMSSAFINLMAPDGALEEASFNFHHPDQARSTSSSTASIPPDLQF